MRVSLKIVVQMYPICVLFKLLGCADDPMAVMLGDEVRFGEELPSNWMSVLICLNHTAAGLNSTCMTASGAQKFTAVNNGVNATVEMNNSLPQVNLVIGLLYKIVLCYTYISRVIITNHGYTSFKVFLLQCNYTFKYWVILIDNMSNWLGLVS